MVVISSQQPAAIIAAGDVLGEGPVWDAHAGRLLWTDIQSRRLRAFDPASGAVDTFAAPERIGSIALLPDEASRVIAAFETGLGLFDLASGQVEWLHRVEAEANGRRFNDGRVDRAGRFWAGTMVEDEAIRHRAEASVWRLDHAGAFTPHFGGVQIANGLAFSPDGKTAYFSDSPLQTIFAFDLDEDGTLSNRRVFAQVTEGYPDGATVDAEGCLWSARWAAGTVVRHAPDGRVLETLTVPASQPTCVAFGGEDLRTLFVTSARDELSEDELVRQPHAGDVFAYDVTVPGLPEPRYTGAIRFASNV